MWKIRVFFGLLFTIVGIINLTFHTTLNLVAALFMLFFAAGSFNLAQKDYYEDKNENKENDGNNMV